ncbi:SDR family NAD(P)-dependent oxidoreductase [Martelella soudanensis]|uniref:SDR family NAD(P)-dependent oxidoreductase n=1 Tax=unclassified Martelella TaxID=2629616 RepID=UPI0015DE4AAD|nr:MULTISPECIES: SDR family oxidoreductase [unclassified Martelella]
MAGHMLITGAGGGIGSATARMAAARGYAVSLMVRPSGSKEASVLLDEIAVKGGEAQVVTADVTSEGDIVDAFKRAVDRFGPLTVLMNSAGIAYNAPVSALGSEDIARVMAVNVVGLMLCCREAVGHMSTETGGQGGSIVNISSMAATIGGRPGASVYAASKGAVDVFTTGFAREVADQGIRVNSVRPGMIATKMTANLEHDAALKKSVEASIPMKRIGQPEEIAEIVLWLSSPAASFVTGAHINAGGGGFHIASS